MLTHAEAATLEEAFRHQRSVMTVLKELEFARDSRVAS
jgi:hypothetical protein